MFILLLVSALELSPFVVKGEEGSHFLKEMLIMKKTIIIGVRRGVVLFVIFYAVTKHK